jgi:cation diffusion facilitator CzcD-associated flavoprotein CzcO
MTRVLLVGAGPAALSAAVSLRCQGLGDDLTVLDPSGRWLATWHGQFHRQDIPHLRSPAVHHPHPEPFALLGAGGVEGLVMSGGARLPTTARFARFTDDLIEDFGLAGVVAPASAVQLRLSPGGHAAVLDDAGRLHRPDRVVLATNTRQPVVPHGLRCALGHERLLLSDRVDVRRAVPGLHVVVVGGGLTAAHLALGAARRGATVTMLARRRLTVRRYDVHPTWLGPKKLRPFAAEPDPQRRRAAIDNARGGGSIPHRIRRQLEDCIDARRLDLRERTEVGAVTEAPDGLHLALSDGARVAANEVWLATGGQLDVTRDPLCATLLAHRPVAITGGLPELATDLSWPGTNVHLSGFATALRLGPTAGNLIGHRRAARRLTAALRGHDPERADRTITGAGACPAGGPYPPSSSRMGRTATKGEAADVPV